MKKLMYLVFILHSVLYVFLFQLNYPFGADVFLYITLFASLVLITLKRIIVFNSSNKCFFIVVVISFIGTIYTPLSSEGLREAIIFLLLFVISILLFSEKDLALNFNKWLYIGGIVTMITVYIQLFFPDTFNLIMKSILRSDCYEQLMWSYQVDHAYAGISAYTANTAFFASVVFGQSFINLVNKDKHIIFDKISINIAMMIFSLFAIILSSKRGIFVAILLAFIIVYVYLFHNAKAFLGLIAITIMGIIGLVILYNRNEIASSFVNRFMAEDITNGRSGMFINILQLFNQGNIFVGNGTAASYLRYSGGVHNIYLQLLYDHGYIGSIFFFIWFAMNYLLCLKSKAVFSLFIESVFLIYGMSGNPLYSVMFMLIYVSSVACSYHAYYEQKE